MTVSRSLCSLLQFVELAQQGVAVGQHLGGLSMARAAGDSGVSARPGGEPAGAEHAGELGGRDGRGGAAGKQASPSFC